MPLAAPNGDLRLVDDVPTAFAGVVLSEFASFALRVPDRSAEDRFRLALSGGDTARACYAELATTPSIDWTSVDLLLGDERCVPPDDPAANQRLVRESLLRPTGDRARFLPMDCADPQAYADFLAAEPPVDVIHLGLGPDGHTASLFPGSRALSAPPGALVVASEDPSGRNPHPRLTFTFEALSRGRLVVFTVAGGGKHAALRRVIDGEDLPAARVQADRVLWLCDRAALDG
jgi:6-phosphogluconolactonase